MSDDFLGDRRRTGAALRPLAGPPADPEQGFAGVQHRARRIRRRHTAARAASLAAVALVVVGGAVALNRPGRDEVVVGTPSTTLTTAPPTTAPATTATPVTAPPTSPSPVTTPSPGAGAETFTSAGGTVVVRTDASGLVLVSVTPAPGYTVDEQRARPEEIEVRFRSGDDEVRVRVVRRDGRPVLDTDDSDAGDDSRDDAGDDD